VSKEPRKAALAFIFVTVMLDILALGMIIPVLPRLVEHFVGGDTVKAAEMYGLYGTVWAAMQFFFAPVLGSLSDRFGRRPVILLSNFGLGLDYVLTALAPSLSWLFVARVISGITSASIPTAGAYIADVLPPEKRAQGFGMLGAAFGVGFVVGPALGGLLGHFDPRLPFWFAAGLSLLNGCWGLFVLPESHPKEARKPFSMKRANPVGALQLLLRQPQLIAMAGVIFCAQLAHHVLPSCFVLYAGCRYDWHELGVGAMLAAVGVSNAIVQALFIKPVVGRLGEIRAIIVGVAAGALGFIGYGLAPTGALLIAVTPLHALWGLAGPPSQGLMSRRVGPGEQGALQGAVSSIQGVTGLIGPTLFTQVFARSIAVGLPGAPFFVSSALLFTAMVIVVTVVRKQKIPDAPRATVPATEASQA
jgi:DHA1 family tetracycline resistance protein-like MFS transporter